MVTLRWILAVVLIAFGGIVVVENDLIVSRWVLTKQKQPSSVPLIGGGIAAIGVALVPITSVACWWWVALLLD